MKTCIVIAIVLIVWGAGCLVVDNWTKIINYLFERMK